MSIADFIITRVSRRQPDFVIGGEANPYIRRWWVIPRNRWFNIYLHQILRPDDDRALHDHPWWNCSIVLRGGYREVTPSRPEGAWRCAGSIVFRGARALHRLELAPAQVSDIGLVTRWLPCWSLFVTGPRIREWGFACPKGWVHWRDFTNPADGGQTVGKGCDQ